MIFGLTDEVIEKINRVFLKYPSVEKVIIYGSRAIGNYKNGSDIDLTLMGDTVTQGERAKISSDLDDLPIPYSFDLSVFQEIDHPELKAHIERVGQVFYLKNKAVI